MINENTIRKTCQDLADLLVRKNHDYGNSVQEQFDEYGLTSILIRLDDKLRRLKTLKTKEGQVPESIADTLKDLAGYSILGLLCLEDEPLPVIRAQKSPFEEQFPKYFDADDQH